MQTILNLLSHNKDLELSVNNLEQRFEKDQTQPEKHYLDIYTGNIKMVIDRNPSYQRALNQLSGKSVDILDLGCGAGYALLGFAQVFNQYNIKIKSYTGLEISPKYLSMLNKRFENDSNIHILRKPIANFLEENDKKFDFVILAHPDNAMIYTQLANTLKLVKQSLKADGIFYFSCFKTFEYQYMKTIFTALLKGLKLEKDKAFVKKLSDTFMRCCDLQKSKMFPIHKHLKLLNAETKEEEEFLGDKGYQITETKRIPHQFASLSRPNLHFSEKEQGQANTLYYGVKRIIDELVSDKKIRHIEDDLLEETESSNDTCGVLWVILWVGLMTYSCYNWWFKKDSLDTTLTHKPLSSTNLGSTTVAEEWRLQCPAETHYGLEYPTCPLNESMHSL